MVFIAVDVVCPIIVLNAKLVIVAIETPLALVLVSKISAEQSISIEPLISVLIALTWNDPTEWSAGGAEREIEKKRHGDESPCRLLIPVLVRFERSHEYRGDDESKHVC